MNDDVRWVTICPYCGQTIIRGCAPVVEGSYYAIVKRQLDLFEKPKEGEK